MTEEVLSIRLDKSAVVRFSVLALLLLVCVGGASAADLGSSDRNIDVVDAYLQEYPEGRTNWNTISLYKQEDKFFMVNDDDRFFVYDYTQSSSSGGLNTQNLDADGTGDNYHWSLIPYEGSWYIYSYDSSKLVEFTFDNQANEMVNQGVVADFSSEFTDSLGSTICENGIMYFQAEDASSGDSMVYSVDPSNGFAVTELTGYDYGPGLTCLPNGNLLAGTSQDDTLTEFEPSTGNFVENYPISVSSTRNRGIHLDKRSGDLIVGSDTDGDSNYEAMVWESAFTFNSAPQFNSSSVDPDPPLIGETADFSYSASDSDGSIQSVDLVLKDDGSTVFTGSKSSATGTFKPSYSLTQGDITATFTATDNAGATATTTISESLQDTKPDFDLEKPVDNKLQGTTDIQVEINNPEDDNKPGENPTVNIKIDGTTKQSFTVEDTEDFTRTVTGVEGSQTLRVEMVEGDGDTTTKTRNLEIDTTAPNVTIEKPVEGSSTNSTTGIPLKFTVSDPNLDTSSYQYRKDGGALFDTSGNTTVDFGTTGSHNITVFAEDTLGNRGQDTVQFTADTKNTLTATDKVTNVQLDNIEARFSNGTSVLEKSVNDSSLEFFTSNIPKGDVNLTVSITGFREKTRTLQNVDKSFNQDISVSLERAGLSLNVFNEEKPDKELERTVIFSNSTSKQQLNKTFFPTDFGGVNTETIQEFNSRTYLDQNKNTPVKAGTLLFDTPYDGGSGDLEYDVYINGDFEKNVKAFNKDSATVKLDEPKRITSLRLEAENRDDGDTYDESATAQAENFRVKAPDKGRTVIDFNALENSEIPTGQDIEITVEGPENFVTRSYFTDITENSKTTLDAFLLKENQGILMTVEARGPENEPVNDALVTVQFQKDNKFKTVAQKKTASDGSAALRLSPNRQYKLDVKKTGLQSFSGTFSPANYQFDPLKIRLGETNNFQKSNTWDSIEFKLLPRTQKLNESPKLNFSVVDSETGITSFGIKVKNSNGTIIDSSLVSGSSSGGSTTLQPNLSNLNNVEIEGFFVKEEEEYKVERYYQVKRSLSPGVASISNIANSFNTVSQGTRSLLAVLVTGFVAFSLKSRVNKKGGSIVTISTLGLFVLIGWIPAFYWMLSLLAIIGILSIR